MKREEKDIIVNNLVDQLKNATHFYLADASELNAESTSLLRRKCFENNIQMLVVKNTLLKRALQKTDYQVEELYPVLEGPTAIMFTETGNAPAKLIKEFRKKFPKPILKGAYVEESVYVGDDQLEALVNVKSKEELLGELIGLLQSPIKTVISQLKTGNNILAGVLETLSDKKE
ncbi:MAG: 50S ribosomal protein L10 [Bacteroidetes bacterium GWC2_33_15]|nr:MAG: 50S ribosomal protein L10 [Bacteroidetes bacterium GWA2_33_15]OFX50329.1 MAG: 50S ribosomal protein L10 [Bacteroidetes bacterium GWC2_33_15]OFX66754.1 MAG: 50S ribosomal protein L10 [Bacteroidetes bacterium GWB2_32_14]OFX69372.1 MAG: 50S ribosomal protein L10 [Bacteroidetes bacterium GWD2_33_33]HAN18694.1 50S ribosomal protein L10 [Bacteroidales bacterium]